MGKKWKWLTGLLAASLICLFMGAYTVSAFTGVKYPYEESDQEKVKVTVTISSDGVPILGKDGTPMSHLDLEVPYFDLGKYNMEEFYRYRTDSECNYMSGDVIKRPTVLHLFIYLMERYYLGLSDSQCGQGLNASALSAPRYDVVSNMFGEEAYSTIENDTANGRSLLKYSGKPKSFYMTNFWGHDENLNYYVNHKYPVMWTDWGASADYILLKDGDIVDLAMFTDWGFYKHSGFAFFQENEYQITAGNILRLRSYIQGGSVADETGTSFTTPNPVMTTELVNYVYNSNWQQIGTAINYDSEGYISCSFSQPGTYYVMSFESAAGGTSASKAPGVTKIVVTDAGESKIESVTVRGQNNKADVMCGSSLQMEAEVLPESAADKSVIWSVDSDYAEIDKNTGVLKPIDYVDSDKDVVVTAFSKADNAVEGSVKITVKPNPADVEKVNNVISLIEAIGSSVDDVTFTPECKARIDAAAAAWTELQSDGKLAAQVSKNKVDFLSNAKERYALLEATATPTPEPTKEPTPTPTEIPTPEPTKEPTPEPTKVPEPQPTEAPAPQPTAVPTMEPTPIPTVTPVPAPIRQTKASANKIAIKWTKDKNASAGYRIYIKGGAFKSFKKVTDVSKSKTSYTISKVSGKALAVGQSYSIKVVSLRKKGSKKVEGNQQVLKTASTLPAQPVFTSAKKAKAGVISLKWKKAAGAQGFEVQMSTKEKSKYKTIKSTSAKTRSLTQKNLKKGQTYYFRMRSFKKVGSTVYYSSWSKSVKAKA
ncbi:hypothetical protein [Ruminococcus sp. 5_1_39BFAA]|uniref:hypothetical protein n=1 Tax=Ruminococcus sp. 5_1_39BFAA TaxID=457412 RepID=UPI0035668E06